jgi:hypothetical protein
MQDSGVDSDGEDGGDVDVTEEDRINDAMLSVEAGGDALEEVDSDGDSGSDGVVDMEDLGTAMAKARAATAVDAAPSDPRLNTREMVTPSQRKALTKEGYKIIGTHSAVKLCRWTKHQLRGRGVRSLLLVSRVFPPWVVLRTVDVCPRSCPRLSIHQCGS